VKLTWAGEQRIFVLDAEDVVLADVVQRGGE
jgi:hypothetical protein